MKQEIGSVSVFFSFIIVMIISVVLSITEIARKNVLKLYLQISSDVAMDSMLSLYHRKLWDFYRIFAVENLNDDLLKKEYIEYLKNNLENENKPINNWFSSKFDEEKFELSYKKIVDEYNFEDNINEYMKYAIIEKTIKLFNKDRVIKNNDNLNFLLDAINETKNNVERKIIYRDIEKKYFNFNKDINKIEKTANTIKINVEKINQEFKDIKNIQTTATDTNIKSVKSKLNSICKTIDNLVSNIDIYFKSMEILREKIVSNREKFNNDALLKEIDIETLNFVNSEFEDFISYTNKNSDMNLSVEKLKNHLSLIKKDIFDFDEIVKGMEEEIDELNLEKKELKKDKENDNTEIIKDINETIKNIQNEIKQCFSEIKDFFRDLSFEIPTLMISEKDYENEKNIIENILGLTENGLLSLVLEKEDIEKISDETNKKIEINLDSKEDIKNKFLEIIYCMDFMNYYKKLNLNEVTNSGSSNLEIEEIISKKDTDKKNFSNVLLKILLIRECMNILYIYTNQDMKRNAKIFTNTTFFFLSPIAKRAINFLVISAWGVAQSIDDLRNLMKGEYVKFFHDSNSWTFQIDDLFNFGSKKNLFKMSDDGLVLNYKDYLMLLLFLQSGKSINEGMCKIMDFNLKKEQENFDMRKNLVSFNVKNSFTADYFFTNMIFLKPKNYDTLININININSYGEYYKK